MANSLNTPEIENVQIKVIEVKNFKSLVDFKIDFQKFNCLIGLNGSGKSTFMQFIDFMSQLVRGDMKAWFAERKWKSTDLPSKLTGEDDIEFRITFFTENRVLGDWSAIYSPTKNHCIREFIAVVGTLIEVKDGEVKVANRSSDAGWEGKPWKEEIRFNYEGSILSVLKDEFLPPDILEIKKYLTKIKSLDLLAPEHLRQRTRESSGTLGRGGSNLASFIHEMSDSKREKLLETLKKVYPQLQGLSAKSLRSGWKQLEIIESYEGQESGLFPKVTTKARHINDGLLRMIAIFAELDSENRFLLIDEIENGINPELVEFVIDTLVATRQQVLVTTHSPMILNYLDDEVAKKGVIYLYKTAKGHTKSIPFFSIPSLRKKLSVMGPGEAFVDTKLIELAEEIASMTKEGK